MNSVSIAMATYNGKSYIGEQLASLANQSVAPAELIVTDDCSNDGTLDVIGHFAITAPFPVRIFKNERRIGHRENFMHAASLCTSDLIAFCDQDDIWDPKKLETCIAYFGDPDVLLTYHNAIVIAADRRSIGTLDAFAAPLTVNPPLSINPWLFGLGFTQIFRRSLPSLLGFWSTSVNHSLPDEPMAHDQWYFFLASVLGSIVYVKEPLAYYRRHGTNHTPWDPKASKVYSLKGAFSFAMDSYAGQEKVALRRAEILAEAGEELSLRFQERASVGEIRYRRLANQYASRKKIYTALKLRDRLDAFLDILSSGGYRRNDSWNFSRKSFLKDAGLGILAGHLLK